MTTALLVTITTTIGRSVEKNKWLFKCAKLSRTNWIIQVVVAFACSRKISQKHTILSLCIWLASDYDNLTAAIMQFRRSGFPVCVHFRTTVFPTNAAATTQRWWRSVLYIDGDMFSNHMIVIFSIICINYFPKFQRY